MNFIEKFLIDNVAKVGIRKLLTLVASGLFALNIPSELVNPFLQSTEALLIGAIGILITALWSFGASKITKNFKGE